MRIPVAIVGGGPAASAAALSLARRGVGSLILERGDDRGDKPGESLPPSALPLLASLDIAGALEGHLAVHGQRSAWGSDVVDEMSFLFSPYGHGWHLDRRRFERLLIERALAEGAVRWAGARVVDVRREGLTWSLRLEHGTDVDCGFLIDATGRASWLARRLGARRVHHDRLVASVAFLDGGRSDSVTLVEATTDGWWYSAALPDDRLAVMSVSDAPLAWDPPELTRGRIEAGGYAMRAPVRRVDAGSARLDRAGGDGWLAIGDAAMAVDPIASQGLVMALATGLAAGETSLDDYAAFIDTSWRAYARMRRACYAAERRWANAPFWRRRREVAMA